MHLSREAEAWRASIGVRNVTEVGGESHSGMKFRANEWNEPFGCGGSQWSAEFHIDVDSSSGACPFRLYYDRGHRHRV